jgi:hypothetical protein
MVVLPLPMSLPYTPSLNPRNGDRIAQSVRNGDRIAQSVRRGDDPRATLLSWPPRSLTDPPSAHRVSPPPPSRTDWTRLVPPPVLTGHAACLA